MSPVTDFAVAEPRRAPAGANDWVLSVPLDNPAAAQLSGAAFAERGPIRCAFAGLLFDRDGLADTVGTTRPDASDAELVLAAYGRWGEAALPRLRGTYAIIILDRRTDRAIVARDPVGLHPLFYARAGEAILFAAAPRFLFRDRRVSCKPNRRALADHLCHRWPLPEETFFESVLRVPAGSRALVADRRCRVDRYWDPTPPNRPIRWVTDDEADGFDDQLDRAVDRCLRTGRTGIFLSGGLDSISVAAVATDHARRSGLDMPATLSLAFPDPSCDERLVQTAIARKLGLAQRLVGFHDAVGPRGLLAEALELNHDLASPVLNTWEPAYLALMRAGRVDGIQTILTGYGGDEWLSVSPYLSADLMRRGDVRGLARFLGVWHRSYTYSRPHLLYSALWRFGLRPLGGQMLKRLAPAAWERRRTQRALDGDPGFISPAADLRDQQRERAQWNLVEADPAAGFYLREVRQSMVSALTSWELEEQHEFGQRAGVRILHPYWDPDLIDLLYRMPPERLMRGGRSKGLVRATVARRFPNLGFERQRKVAATAFYRTILQTEGPAIVRSVGALEALGSLGVVEPTRTRALLRDAFDTGGNDLHRMWHLVNLETWARPYVN